LKFRKKIVALMILAAIQFPCTIYAADEDKELAPIAAEQPRGNEQIEEINPALTEKISTKPTKETEKDIKKRKKKLKQARKEKEDLNERKLRESTKKPKDTRRDETIIIDPNEPEMTPPEPPPTQIQPVEVRPQPVKPAQVQPQPKPQPQTQPAPQPVTPPQTQIPPPTVETRNLPDQKSIYNNFAEVARAVKFIPLYMPRKSGYEITGIFAERGIAEIRYGRRWEPTVSLTVRTHKRAEGEQLQDISGVEGVKWRVDTTTGTTIYIAKISDTQQVAAWAVGHYTFSARAENLSFAGFHSLVADELVELSTHYYLDL